MRKKQVSGFRWWLWLSASLAGCGAPTTSAPVEPAGAGSAAAMASTSASANDASAPSYTLKLPERWSRAAHEGFETLTDPDHAVKLHVVETRGGALDAAIQSGWKKAAPAMALKERSRSQGAKNERFSEQLVITYTDDANEKMAQGVALRHAKDAERVYVLLIEGPIKAVQKRGAELSRIITSLEVAGVTKLTVKAADVQPFDVAKQAAFFAFLEEARERAGVPGAAVAVVTPEGVVTKGFGVRSVGGGQPVGPDTQFMIGSITKSFSTLLLATLVDEGKLTWETAVKDVYPTFALGDARGDSVEIRHLFCACVGAPRQDMELLFEFAGKKPKDVFSEVAKMKLTSGFGETFQYNNQLTAAGGYVAGHVAKGGPDVGRAYERALEERVLGRIGMTSTMLSEAKVRARKNHASPHHLDWSGQTEVLDLSLERFVVPYAPAGALWSTADDMAKYLALQLARGKNAAGEVVVSEPNLRRTQTAQVKVSDETGYGMGWLVGTHKGLAAIEHSGGTMGFNSDLVFFPEIGVGLFVVANRSPAAIHGAVRARLIELLFALPATTKDKHVHDIEEMLRLIAEPANKLAEAPVPQELLGVYQSSLLGKITLRAKGKGVELDAGEWRAGLAVVDPKERENALMITSGVMQGGIFLVDATGDNKRLVLKHSQTDYVFERVGK